MIGQERRVGDGSFRRAQRGCGMSGEAIHDCGRAAMACRARQQCDVERFGDRRSDQLLNISTERAAALTLIASAVGHRRLNSTQSPAATGAGLCDWPTQARRPLIAASLPRLLCSRRVNIDARGRNQWCRHFRFGRCLGVILCCPHSSSILPLSLHSLLFLLPCIS